MVKEPIANSIWPPITSAIAGPAPLYGTWIMSMPASSFSSSPARWFEEPLPPEAKVRRPGCRRASATSSFTLVAGTDETVLPGLLDCEARIVADYGHVIAIVPAEDAPLRALLLTQRAAVQSRIDMLRGLLPRTPAAINFTPEFRPPAGARAEVLDHHP